MRGGIIGIGGVNIDYIISSELFIALPGDTKESLRKELWVGTERAISGQQFDSLLKHLPPGSYRTRPGGSALNTILALAGLGADLPVAFIGSCGRSSDSKKVRSALEKEGIDVRNIRISDLELSGSCLSVEYSGDRSLLTTPGANDDLSGIILDQGNRLSRIIAEFAIVHVTSLLDERAPAAIYGLLRQAKALNAGLAISFDPGAQWSRALSGNDDIGSLAAIADWIFLNPEEYALWKASGLLETIKASVFRKAPQQITVFNSQALRKAVEFQSVILSTSEIKDSTGAGDTFAAGVLAALLEDPSDLTRALALAQAMAIRKLRGGEGDKWFPEYRDLWHQRNSLNSSSLKGMPSAS